MRTQLQKEAINKVLALLHALCHLDIVDFLNLTITIKFKG